MVVVGIVVIANSRRFVVVRVVRGSSNFLSSRRDRRYLAVDSYLSVVI